MDIPFNFSKINNLAVKESRGEYLLFLNNDVQSSQKGWMTSNVSFAQQEHIGAVGQNYYIPMILFSTLACCWVWVVLPVMDILVIQEAIMVTWEISH